MGGSGTVETVLVVDDDADHALMLEVALGMRGYSVVCAHSFNEAVAILRSREIDALVCDMTLGDGTAIDVLTAPAVRAPRISVVLSGFDEDELRERTRAAGFHAHLVKPASVDQIVHVLGKRESGTRLAKPAATDLERVVKTKASAS